MLPTTAESDEKGTGRVGLDISLIPMKGRCAGCNANADFQIHVRDGYALPRRNQPS